MEESADAGDMSDSDYGGNPYKPYRFSGKSHSFDAPNEKPILK
jgi:hypothetical protein